MIHIKTCPKCGIEFKTTMGYQKYCSHACSNRGRKTVGGTDYDKTLVWVRCTGDYSTWECPYQSNVGCQTRECSKCGWNPKVAAARMEKFAQENKKDDREFFRYGED